MINYSLNIGSKVWNKIAGCLQDSRGMFAKIYINDRYKEQSREA